MVIKPCLKIPPVIKINLSVFHQRHIRRQSTVFLNADGIMINFENRNKHKADNKRHKNNIDSGVLFYNFELRQIIHQLIASQTTQCQNNNKHFPVKNFWFVKPIKILAPKQNKKRQDCRNKFPPHLKVPLFTTARRVTFQPPMSIADFILQIIPDFLANKLLQLRIIMPDTRGNHQF